MNDVLKTLTIKSFHINEVKFSNDININNSILTIHEPDFNYPEGVIDCKIDIIKSNCRNVVVNSIMDVVPISTKVYGELGTGITHTLTGTYILICAKLNNGEQVKNFGCCSGNLGDIVVASKPSTFGDEDILIHFDLLLDENIDQKTSIYNGHLLVDQYTQNIRNHMKIINGTYASEVYTYKEQVKKKSKKIAVIKQISGQGAMENNIILPDEPCGVEGGKTIMDLQNMPVVISPNEYRDGAIRALT